MIVLRRKTWALLAVMASLTFWAAGCEREELDPSAMGADASEAGESSVNRMNQYRTRTQGAELKTGEEGVVEFQVLPGPELKINLEFPWRMEWEAPEGVVLATTTFDASSMELDDEIARVPLSVEVNQPGRHEIRGVANFSVCNDDRCDILQGEEVSFVVHAE